MRTNVLGFSGRIGSGKSTLSRLVASKIGWSWASFGKVVRDEAVRRGSQQTREILQTIGQQLIDSGWNSFCKKVLESAKWHPGQHLVIDGIRHIEAIETLGQLAAPSEVRLVYVALDEPVRQSRLVARGDFGVTTAAEQHPVESQVPDALLNRADLVVDSSGSEEHCVVQVVEWLRSQNLAL